MHRPGALRLVGLLGGRDAAPTSVVALAPSVPAPSGIEVSPDNILEDQPVEIEPVDMETFELANFAARAVAFVQSLWTTYSVRATDMIETAYQKAREAEQAFERHTANYGLILADARGQLDLVISSTLSARAKEVVQLKSSLEADQARMRALKISIVGDPRTEIRVVDAWVSGLIYTLISLALGAVEVAVIYAVNKSMSNAIEALGITAFAIAGSVVGIWLSTSGIRAVQSRNNAINGLEYWRNSLPHGSAEKRQFKDYVIPELEASVRLKIYIGLALWIGTCASLTLYRMNFLNANAAEIGNGPMLGMLAYCGIVVVGFAVKLVIGGIESPQMKEYQHLLERLTKSKGEVNKLSALNAKSVPAEITNAYGEFKSTMVAFVDRSNALTADLKLAIATAMSYVRGFNASTAWFANRCRFLINSQLNHLLRLHSDRAGNPEYRTNHYDSDIQGLVISPTLPASIGALPVGPSAQVAKSVPTLDAILAEVWSAILKEAEAEYAVKKAAELTILANNSQA